MYSDIVAPRFGIIGCGSIFPYYYRGINELNLQLIACACRTKPKSSFFNTYKLTYMPNPYDLIRSKDIGMIILASPPSSHYDYLRHCIEYNKVVICEKPLTLTYQEYKKIKALANSKKNKVYAAYHARFQPVLLEAKKIIANTKRKSELIEVIVNYTEDVRNYHSNASWVFDRDISGGGCVIDSGINAISVLEDVLGELKPVKSLLCNEYRNVETRADILLHTKTEVPVIFTIDWVSKEKEDRTYIFKFSNGTRVSFNFVDSTIRIITTNNTKEIRVAISKDENQTSMSEEYLNLLKDFLNFYKSNDLINDIAGGPLKTVDLIYRLNNKEIWTQT